MKKEIKPTQKAAGEIVVGKQKYLPTTSVGFWEIYNLNKVQRDLSHVKTVRDALMVETPSLTLIRKQYGERAAEAYIKLWIIQLNEFLNVARPLTELQIDECARLILKKHWTLSIADINLIFETAKMGGYGSLYESLSMDKILLWFDRHLEDRLNIAGQMSQESNRVLKTTEGETHRLSSNWRGELKKMDEAAKQYNLEQLKKKYKK